MTYAALSFYFPRYCELSRPTEQFFCSTWCWWRVIHGAVFHWEFSWIWNIQNDLTHVFGVLVLAVDWVPCSLLFCEVLSLYLALLIQQYSQSFLPTWQLASKRNKAEAASFLRVRPRTGTASFLPHSVGQSTSQGQPRFTRKGNRTHLLMGGLACVYRDGKTCGQPSLV